MLRRNVLAAFAVAVAMVGFGGHAATAEEVTLKVISAYPKTHNFNKPLLGLIDEVNAEGAGKVNLRLVGGPEAMPSGEMMQGISNGVVDVFYGASSLFIGDVPQAMAQNGSNMSAMELRENGALALLSKSFEKNANATYLGYFGSGYTFYVYLLDDPKMTPSGGVDLKGWKIRGGAPYQTFIDRLGGIMIGLFQPDMYSAMERRVVDAIAWTSVSVADDGWEQFIKYRIKPGWRQGDIALVGNHGKWESLPDDTKAFLEEKIAKYERIAHESFMQQAVEEETKLKAAGMKDIVLEGEDRKEWLHASVGLLWEDMKQTLPADEVDALKEKFYKE